MTTTDTTTAITTIPAAALAALRLGVSTCGTAQLQQHWSGHITSPELDGTTPTTSSRALFTVSTEDRDVVFELAGPTILELLPGAESTALANLVTAADIAVNELILAELTAAGFDVDPDYGDWYYYQVTTTATTIPAETMAALRAGVASCETAQLIHQWGGQVAILDDGDLAGEVPTGTSRAMFHVSTEESYSAAAAGPALEDILPHWEQFRQHQLPAEAADTIDVMITDELKAAGFTVTPGSGDGALIYTVTLDR